MKIALLEEELAASMRANEDAFAAKPNGSFSDALHPTPLKQHMTRVQRIAILTNEVQSNNRLMLNVLRTHAPLAVHAASDQTPSFQVSLATRK